VQEVEEARVPHLEPPALAVEVRQRDEEVGEGAVLPGEQLGEALREVAGVVHPGIVSPGLAPSVEGLQSRPLARS
jgi:hypothetical protein